MTIADAIKECQCKLSGHRATITWWIRPICWRGSPRAVDVLGNALWIVPRGRLRPQRYVPLVDELLDEWEVVDSAVVLGER